MRTALIVLACLLLHQVPGLAQDTLRIVGTVTANTDEAAINTLVVLTGKNGVVKGIGLTDIDGNFQIKAIACTGDTLVVKMPGYHNEYVALSPSKSNYYIKLTLSGKSQEEEVIIIRHWHFTDEFNIGDATIITSDKLKHAPW